MKVFRVRANVDYQTFDLSNEKGRFWADYAVDSCRLATHWGKVLLKKDSLRHKHGQGNFADCRKAGRNLVIDARAHGILAPILDQEFEILPIEPYLGVEYYFLNVLKQLDCIDWETTTWKDGRIAGFHFFTDKLTDSTIFRITGARGLFTAVGRPGAGIEFKTVVEQEGLTGLLFEEVWSDDDAAIRTEGVVESVLCAPKTQSTGAASEDGKGDSNNFNVKSSAAEADSKDADVSRSVTSSIARRGLGNGNGGMKVYKVDLDLDYQSFYLSNHDSKIWREWVSNKDRLEPEWVRVSLKKTREQRPQGNFAYCWMGNRFLMDARAQSILAPILDQEIEILPIEPFRGVDYCFVNVLKELDCLDRERTIYEGIFGRLSDPVYQFFPDRLTDSTLFSVKWASGLFAVVGRPGAEVEFKTVVEQAGLTGLEFKEVWSDGVPVVRRKGFVESVIFPAKPQSTGVAGASGKNDSKISNVKPFVAWADTKDPDDVEDWDEEQPSPSLGISDRKEAIEVIRNSAFSAHVEPLATALRPSARIFICKKDGTERVGGARLTISHFGGKPTLPENVAWPTWNRTGHIQEEIAELDRIFECAQRKAGDSSEDLTKNYQDKIAEKRREMLAGESPLAFLGQLSLREIQAVAPLPGWPKEGILAFFYDPAQAWGGSPQDRGHCRIHFFPEDAPLRQLDYPELLGEEGRYPERALTARCEWTLSKYVKLKNDPIPFQKKKGYLELLEKLNADGSDAKGPVHRCGGYAQEIQKPLRTQCQLVAGGLHNGDSSGKKVPIAAEVDKAAMDWQLVMQFDSEMSLNWEWGSGGRVYFMARKQDIAAGDFSKCWAILQCD